MCGGGMNKQQKENIDNLIETICYLCILNIKEHWNIDLCIEETKDQFWLRWNEIKREAKSKI